MPEIGQASLSDNLPINAQPSRRQARKVSGSHIRCAWIAIGVHVEAAFRHPAKYLAAAWWRVLGKRLRARSRLAPLLGSSRHAYSLWLCQQEALASDRRTFAAIAPPPLHIVAIVDASSRYAGLDATLQSLDVEGVTAIVVSDAQLAGRSVVNTVTQALETIKGLAECWLMPTTAGDILAPGAVTTYAAALAHSPARIAYADDDLIDGKGRRHTPHFKPDWNEELFRHFDYLSGSAIIRTSKDQLTALGEAPDWSRHLIEIAARETPPLHVREVLHHRRERPQPRVPASLTKTEGDLPGVSVIIPTRNRADLLQTCLNGLAATDYPNLEVIVVDNDSDDPQSLAYLGSLDPSRVRVLRHHGPFNFATINNRAARETSGGILCLLNNDVEVIDTDWLSVMVQQSMRDEVGAVGAQLLYPDGRIQHAGVILGVGGGAAHSHRLIAPADEGYFCRHQLPQYVSAVTAACLVIQRERFMTIGGFDEKNFAVAFNDVDLCLRLNNKGWQSFYEPRARLVHHESVSRGFDRDPIGARRLAGELEALKRRWGTSALVDPYHHPYLSPHSEQFVVSL